MTKEISCLIANLRLPLMVCIVFIHCYIVRRPNMHTVEFIENLFSNILSSAAVPLFMFISGYLFFVLMPQFSFHDYVSKLKKRFRTLLIPYLIWNTIIICCFWCIHVFMPTFINPDFEPVNRFNLIQFLNCYFSFKGPIAFQFWYIRDLMVFVLLAPLVYLMVKTTAYTLPVLFLLSFLIDIKTVEIFFYFSLGAYFAVHKMDFIKFFEKFNRAAVCLFVFGMVYLLWLHNHHPTLTIIVRRIFILAFSISILSFKPLRVHNIITDIFEKYSNTSFWIFAYHALPCLLIARLLNYCITSNNQMIWIVLYFSTVIFVVVFGIITYKIFMKVCPTMLKVFTGGR